MIDEIIIAGATATGKTGLSIELAKILNAEIISVDSRQCYKQLDIGTAKPTKEELSEAVHHNISVLDVDENDSAAKFYERINTYKKEIKSKGKKVIYCGGSTLHLQSLIQPLDDMPSSNRENMAELERLEKKLGLEKLYEMLEKHDPEYSKKMDGLNRQRIYRALDVWMQTGKPFSSFHKRDKENLKPPKNMAVFVLEHPRKVLHQRISLRTDQMFESGFVDEVKQILAEYYSRELQSLQTVGYREVIKYLENEMIETEMIEKVKTSTRRYAKRQITWMRKWPFAKRLNMFENSLDENLKKVQLAL